MGNCAEVCADTMNITREMQDNYAIESYKRAQKAVTEGKFKSEIVPVEIKGRKGVTVVDTDEEAFKVCWQTSRYILTNVLCWVGL